LTVNIYKPSEENGIATPLEKTSAAMTQPIITEGSTVSEPEPSMSSDMQMLASGTTSEMQVFASETMTEENRLAKNSQTQVQITELIPRNNLTTATALIPSTTAPYAASATSTSIATTTTTSKIVATLKFFEIGRFINQIALLKFSLLV
jgi:hypothetical protein